jgi:hypothetical protein
MSLTVGGYVGSLAPADGAAQGDAMGSGALAGSGERDAGGMGSVTDGSFRGFVEHRS